MVDYQSIAAAYEDRVGFRDIFNTVKYGSLDPDLLKSESGLVVNSVSEKWLRAELVADCFEQFDVVPGIAAWNGTTNYGQTGGQKVSVTDGDGNRLIWISKANDSEDNLNKTPGVGSAFWETAFSRRLREFKESAAKEAIKTLLIKRQEATYTRSINEYDTMFNADSVAIVDNKKDDFYRAIRIIPSNIPNQRFSISDILLKVDSPQTIKFYLHHSDRETLIKEYDIEITAADVTQGAVWKKLVDSNGDPDPIQIDTHTDQYNKGGEFYFGFDESDVTGNIFAWDVADFINVSIGRLFRHRGVGYTNDPRRSVFVGLDSIRFKADDKNTPMKPNVSQYFDNYEFINEVPFNLRYSITDDNTKIILDNIKYFDELYQMKLAFMILHSMLQSERVNKTASNADAKIDEVLFGDPANDGNGGLVEKMESVVMKAVEDTREITPDGFGLVSKPM
jgi:hypothetical protein